GSGRARRPEAVGSDGPPWTAGSRQKRPKSMLYGLEPSLPSLRRVTPHGTVEHAPRAPKTARCRIRPSRDVLYRDTPSRMPYDGVIWILVAIVWYSAVLYGGWPHNYKFGFLHMAEEGGH